MRRALRKLGVDEWFICTVMALYAKACTVVRTDVVGLSESWSASRLSTESTVVCCCHGCLQ